MLTRIQKIVTWYSKLPRDFADVGLLMHARARLSTYLAEMAMQVTQLYAQKNGAEFQRKAAHAEALRAAMGIEKTSAAAAKVIADSETMDAVQREYDADAEHQAAKMLYDAFRNVCDVMNQHISNLKSEKRNEFTNTGSQNT